MMTREEALKRMQDAAALGREDPEAAHAKADEVLCELLGSLGYGDVVEAFYNVSKYYS